MNPPIATQRILYAVARRAGLEPIGENANLDITKSRQILGFMDERLREGWESYDFLETTLYEQRAFADDYDPKRSYCAGDFVWDWCSNAYYQALAPTIGGTLANTAIWQQNVNPPYPRMIPWWQRCHTPIGRCFSAWNKNPYTDTGRIRIPFLESQEGLQFSLSQVTQTIWLVFRIPYPGIGLDQWYDVETYNTGDTCYYGMDTYISLIDNNLANTPPSLPAEWDSNWRLFRIPWVFKQFLTQAAFSDTLVVEGQNEKAPGELQAAYTALGNEYDKQTIQSDQFTGYSARVV